MKPCQGERLIPLPLELTASAVARPQHPSWPAQPLDIRCALDLSKGPSASLSTAAESLHRSSRSLGLYILDDLLEVPLFRGQSALEIRLLSLPPHQSIGRTHRMQETQETQDTHERRDQRAWKAGRSCIQLAHLFSFTVPFKDIQLQYSRCRGPFLGKKSVLFLKRKFS